MEFLLKTKNKIRGDQLADEIKKSTGLDVRLSFLPPDVVEINHPDAERLAAQIQAVVTEHVPQAQYFDKESRRHTAIQSLRARAQGNNEAAANARDILTILGLDA